MPRLWMKRSLVPETQSHLECASPSLRGLHGILLCVKGMFSVLCKALLAIRYNQKQNLRDLTLGSMPLRSGTCNMG